MIHSYSQKLFYGKYPYSVKLLFSHFNTENLFRYGRKNSKGAKILNAYKKQWAAAPQQGYSKLLSNLEIVYPGINNIPSQLVYPEDIKGTMHVNNVRTYFTHKSDYEMFIEMFKDNVIETVAPVNDNHLKMMSSGVDMEIRDKLFYGKHKYRINFSWKAHSDEIYRIREMIEQLHDDSLPKKQQKYTQHNYDRIVYLSDEDDVIMFRMAFSEHITRILMVFTPSDLI